MPLWWLVPYNVISPLLSPWGVAGIPNSLRPGVYEHVWGLVRGMCGWPMLFYFIYGVWMVAAACAQVLSDCGSSAPLIHPCVGLRRLLLE